jgi:hypothetical protein
MGATLAHGGVVFRTWAPNAREHARRYSIDFPWPGRWREIFNSNYYDHFPNRPCRATAEASSPTKPDG